MITPEHVHLLILPRRSEYSSHAILAAIKRPVAREAMDWLERNRPEFLARLTVRNRNRTYRHFWQVGPGQDHNVYNPATAYQILDYIHNNPVKRGLVNHSDDWPWSSARDWAGYADTFLKVDKTRPPIPRP